MSGRWVAATTGRARGFAIGGLIAMLALVAGCGSPAPKTGSDAAAGAPGTVAAAGEGAQVYLIRGLADVFSLGMNTLADKLRQRGVDAETWRLGGQGSKLDLIERRYGDNDRRGPIILLGHSFGADLAMEVAGALYARDIPVDLVVTFDPTKDGPVTANVRKLVNLHTGGDGIWKIVRAPEGFPGVLVNIDVTRRPDLVDHHLNHFNLEKDDRLHQEVIDEILAILRRYGEQRVAAGADERLDPVQ